MKSMKLRASVLLLAISASIAHAAVKPDEPISFLDPEDGKLDMSAFLTSAYGFMPVPMIITEPAVGVGGGMALLFMQDSVKDRAAKMEQARAEGKNARLKPPSVTGVAGFGTENGTWGGGAFHSASWKNDAIRYVGALVYADVNLDYYGRANEEGETRKIGYNIKPAALYQKILFRVAGLDLFLGADYIYANMDMTLDVPIDDFPTVNGDLDEGGLGAIAMVDTRDNIFTPNSGWLSELRYQHFDTIFGGDREYDKGQIQILTWMQLHPKLVLGLRGDAQFSGGDIPFYMLPFIELRGIPAMRYQGENTFVAETELRWDVTPRWSLVGFIGSGWVADDSMSDFEDSDAYVAGGLGFRYLIAKAYNMRTGLDVAQGPEDTAVYLTVGSAW